MTVARAGIEILGPVREGYEQILADDAMAFVAELSRRFEGRRQELLQRRRERQAELDSGKLPDFVPETEGIRQGEWRVAAIPDDLMDRRVEITGPVDRKMIINALNSGASVFMADFEDSNAPTWDNNLEGQLNLYDAVRRTIAFISPEGKEYRLKERPATLMVRPRGWHLDEKHVKVDGQPISGSLFDFGLYFFHNVREGGRYFYLPKLENHLEARLWNDVFNFAQDYVRVGRGTLRATVLIETILAAFEMDEILYELRDHSAGLNCGRWDYIFSFIKRFRNRADFMLPDRAQVTMDRAFLKAYVDLLIHTCHRRGIHAMGGMAAQIPIKNDPVANEAALTKVRQDKLREVKAGHDGTWVAHPGLVPVARDIFDEHMPGPNQLGNLRPDVRVTAKELLEVPQGSITRAGLHLNIDVGIQYLEAWLRGVGCVPIYNLMEDAATAEISRTQVWQWVRHGARTSEGDRITAEMVRTAIADELAKLRERLGSERFDSGRFAEAARLFEEMMTSRDCAEFMTLQAYQLID
ncbi:MAG: malate synthase A [Candidatus Eremiobacterota bacterium]